MKENCHFCAFYNKTDEDKGECRKNPPTVVFNQKLFHIYEITVFPKVQRNDWCGAHKGKE